MRILILNLISFFVLGGALATSSTPYEVKEINTLSINSAITPATLDYLRVGLKKLPTHSLALIKLNTPGGLVNTTKDIITLIGDLKQPVAVWVTPEGASASSAGAFIASSAHFIFMAPGTNLGAATPVGLGSDLKESDGRTKALNDLTALVRSLNRSRGRPSAPFEEMITKGSSFSADEALGLRIIDGIVNKEAELRRLLEGRSFTHQGTAYQLRFQDSLVSRSSEPTVGQKVFEVLADPSTAYVFFLLGLALLYFELQAPGGYVAGAIGSCLLLLSGMAFQVLPLDWGALGLIILGVILLVLEVYITSYGILSIAGLSCFIMGSLFLYEGEAGFITVQYSVMLSSLAAVAVSVGIILYYIYRDKQRQGKAPEFFLPVGEQGTVTSVHPQFVQVKVMGEIWKATATTPLAVGDRVEVTGMDPAHLVVQVSKVQS